MLKPIELLFMGIANIKKFLELDFMEYSSDANAQAAYVTNAPLVPIAAYATGSNTLLSHFDVAKATSTTAATGQTITYAETADCVDTQSKFGGKSLLLDGNSDYVTVPDSADWDFTGGNGTIDMWIYPISLTSSPGIIGQCFASSNDWCVYIASDGAIKMGKVGINEPVVSAAGAVVTGSWQHIAIVKNGLVTKIYVNGYEVATGNNDAWTASAQPLVIGLLGYGAGYYYDGYIDEVRILKGTAVWTEPFYGTLQSYSEATIKTQGSYSLKAVSTQTSSLNNTLTKTFSTINLSGVSKIIYDMRATRTGSNIKIELVDTSVSLLCHFNGTNGETTYSSDDVNARVATFTGSAKLSTAQKVFGTSSLLLASATSDYLTFPDSSDWNFGTGDFTIGFRVRFPVIDGSTTHAFCSRINGTTGAGFDFLIGPDSGYYYIEFRVSETGDIYNFTITSDALSIVANTWYAVEINRLGNNLYIFLNGVLVGSSTSNVNIPNTSTAFIIGVSEYGTYYFNGYIDEFYLLKGLALHTTTYTLLTAEFNSSTPTISTINVFERKEWDISKVLNANKSAITKLKVSVSNADAANAFYIDNVRYK